MTGQSVEPKYTCRPTEIILYKTTMSQLLRTKAFKQAGVHRESDEVDYSLKSRAYTPIIMKPKTD